MIGVLDWGIGGLAFHRSARVAFPRQDIIYWSDAGRVPYGRMPEVALRQRVAQVAKQLKIMGVSHLVVACNAASSVLPRVEAACSRDLQPRLQGVITPGAAAALLWPGVIGVVGGRRTILSESYSLALAGRTVIQRVAQPLSALIEAGKLDSPAMSDALNEIMLPLVDVDVLILGCTHYPAIASRFQALAPRARLIDPAAATLAVVEANWAPEFVGVEVGSDRFLTTGDSQAMRRAAKRAFGIDLPEIETTEY